MPVLRLIRKSRNQETVETLEWMLDQARKGKLPDFFGGFRDSEGIEHRALTGIYKAHPSKVISALVRMKVNIAFEDSTLT